jgi:hypothetical protein
VSDFFEPPPPHEQPQPPRYRTPEWLGPPPGTLPGIVPVELVLARTDKVAVCLTHLAGYPKGFSFEITTLTDPEDQSVDHLMLEQHRLQREPVPEGIPPELLRLGVQFSDGGKVTNVGGRRFDSSRPSDPVMIGGGGGGGGGRWTQQQWVWPLPPPGTVQIVCQWPAADIPLTTTEFDAQVLLDAATRAQVIFSDQHLPEPPDDGDDGIAVNR